MDTIKVGQRIVARIDSIRWPAEVVKVNTDGSLKVNYGVKWSTTVTPSEVVSYHVPFEDMPLDHPITTYETALEYNDAFYCPEWPNRKGYAVVEWQPVYWNPETDERRHTLVKARKGKKQRYDDDSDKFQLVYQTLVIEIPDKVCKYYLCDRIATPKICDGFTDDHTMTADKLLANTRFIECVREVDPTGRRPIYVLDTGNTSRMIREAEATNAIVVVNPTEEELELPRYTEHQKCTMHEFMSCRFHQEEYQPGHVGLDYCGEFKGNRLKTLPEADLKALFEGVLDHNTVLWVTFNMRHLTREQRDHHVEYVFAYLVETGRPLGFTLHLKHSHRYGVRNDMVYLIIHAQYHAATC